MYNSKDGRASYSILKKVKDIADTYQHTSTYHQAVSAIVQALISEYSKSDKVEEDIEYLLSENLTLEERLEEELVKNKDFKLVIH